MSSTTGDLHTMAASERRGGGLGGYAKALAADPQLATAMGRLPATVRSGDWLAVQQAIRGSAGAAASQYCWQLIRRWFGRRG